jgi:shikimate kinase
MDSPVVHIVLIGPMGVGKSTIGGDVAASLGRIFLDSDDVIESDFGMTGSEITASRSVEELHSIELAVFGRMAATMSPAVIAPAESVVDDPSGRLLLSTHLSVWLDAPDDLLATRRASGIHRRTISEEQARTLRTARRRHLEVCTIGRVDATAPVEACVDAVIRLVAQRFDS